MRVVETLDASPERARLSHTSALLNPVDDFVIRKLPLIKVALSPNFLERPRELIDFRQKHLRLHAAGTIFGDDAKPHLDDDAPLRVFFSFNSKAPASRCIPRAYAGQRVTEFFEDADMSHAVGFPGVSIYAIKLSEQVHCAPSYVPPVQTRITYMKDYVLERG